ncbi:LysR family transcriptional regulator [Tenggerimyces flavus]|uniref:LysR family transcriptional regulator n=1 Tax=Tenggerimyces flavus TaxID=1708749 RepID=A0ABV7YBL9_9ACTN|nr:LysR family transcriptional regulator [Tenggerimyces flavus]MBM7786627.1 DNA-binding transcriptional LysR family regulator [Tenggerimyces flavus]
MSEDVDLFAHLEAYVAVCQERSFSRAAELLGIAQPLLSRRIKTLEGHLGGELFDRSRRQIEATALGELLLPYAKDVLNRAEHLHEVARSARESAVRAIGVPPDCDPVALARILRAGASNGLAVSVHELSADERAAGLEDGSLAFAVLRVPPETAALRVPLGLAGGGARPVHLEDLRPRRGADTEPPSILTAAEDDVPFAADRLRRACARAGLPEPQLRPVASTATALAETLAGNGRLLCTERFARRHDVAWAPLADPSLHRGYDLGGAPPEWLTGLLGAALGAVAAVAPRLARRSDDARSRLAARG